jgi:glycine/D-amino acid oxidase-like deaminating enzyme
MAAGSVTAVIADLGDGRETRLDADVVVVAAGFAGVALVAPHLAAPIDVRRIPHFTTYWDVPEAEAAGLALGRLPVFAELGADLYGFPDDGESGFKIAWHSPRFTEGGAASGPPEDPEALREAAVVRFPALRRAKLRSLYRCAYDATADEGFLVGPVGGARGLWLVGGMSGHGFKHGPALGESVAAAIHGEPTVVDLALHALPRADVTAPASTSA